MTSDIDEMKKAASTALVYAQVLFNNASRLEPNANLSIYEIERLMLRAGRIYANARVVYLSMKDKGADNED